MAPLSNNEIKRIKSLSQKKFRDELGLFVVEGDKMVAEALRSDFEVVDVYRREDVGEAVMARISSLSTPSPSLAVIRIPESRITLDDAADNTINQLHIPTKGLLLGLDVIRDPGNLGTILRVADWFGIRDIYATNDTVDVYNPKVIQATMGSIFRVRLHYCDLAAAAKEVSARGGRVYGTFLDGSNIYESPLEDGSKAPSMIIIGNEANGISDSVAAEVTDRLLIPSYGHSRCESLNAATATAVTIAEFRRRSLSK